MGKNRERFVSRPCPYCMRMMTESRTKTPEAHQHYGLWTTIEHIIAQRDGGLHNEYNIINACARCNNLRGHLNYELFCAFARVIIRPFPNAPTAVLRIALRDFVEQLAMAAFDNKRHAGNALRTVLLSHAEQLGANS